MSTLKNIFANTESKIALGLIGISLFFTMSCKTSKYAAAKLKIAQDKEAFAKERFDIFSDSCLYDFGNQMPEGIRKQIFSKLPVNATKKDSVEVLTIRVNEVLEMLSPTDPKRQILEGVSRNGIKTLIIWPEFLSAQEEVKKAEALLAQRKQVLGRKGRNK